jgi:hypothetical protein
MGCALECSSLHLHLLMAAANVVHAQGFDLLCKHEPIPVQIPRA